MDELSLAVVGIRFPNEDRSNRMFELLLCKPGEAVDLRPEPRNPHDPRAVAVFSTRGVQIGYLSAERAPWIGARIRDGQLVEATFQDLDEHYAVIRVRFGGGAPTLPPNREKAPRAPSAPTDDFYPDPDPPEWGA